jgi:hypothetical protein
MIEVASRQKRGSDVISTRHSSFPPVSPIWADQTGTTGSRTIARSPGGHRTSGSVLCLPGGRANRSIYLVPATPPGNEVFSSEGEKGREISMYMISIPKLAVDSDYEGTQIPKEFWSKPLQAVEGYLRGDYLSTVAYAMVQAGRTEVLPEAPVALYWQRKNGTRHLFGVVPSTTSKKVARRGAIGKILTKALADVPLPVREQIYTKIGYKPVSE